MTGTFHRHSRTSTAGVVRMVQGHAGEQTKNQKVRSASAEEAEEVEQGRYEARDEPPASRYGRKADGKRRNGK